MTPSGRQPFRGAIAAAGILLLVALAELAGFRSWGDLLTGSRPPDKFDQFYRYVAQQLVEPRLCEKIPWSVMAPGGWDYSPSYERSECYETIAGNTRDEALCWKVKRLGGISILRHQTSMWSCLARARRGQLSGIGMAPEDLVHFFALIGYGPSAVQAAAITPPLVSAKDIYMSLTDRYGSEVRRASEGGNRIVLIPGLVDQKTLLARIEVLIGRNWSQSKPGAVDVEDLAYLTDMAALITRDAFWCLRIPADLELASQGNGFRNWCLFKVALESRNNTVCSKISAGGGADPRLSLRAECIREVTSAIPASVHNAPEVPPDDKRTRLLLALLKIPIPRPEDSPVEQIYQADDLFLHELAVGKDAMHVDARQRFVACVYHLHPNH